jgi:hypothetical protein
MLFDDWNPIRAGGISELKFPVWEWRGKLV